MYARRKALHIYDTGVCTGCAKLHGSSQLYYREHYCAGRGTMALAELSEVWLQCHGRLVLKWLDCTTALRGRTAIEPRFTTGEESRYSNGYGQRVYQHLCM